MFNFSYFLEILVEENKEKKIASEKKAMFDEL